MTKIPFKLIWNDFQAYGSRDNKMYYLCLTVTGEELTTFRKLHREKLLIDIALHAVADTVGSFMNLTDYKSAIFDTYAGHRNPLGGPTIPTHISEAHGRLRDQIVQLKI